MLLMSYVNFIYCTLLVPLQCYNLKYGIRCGIAQVVYSQQYITLVFTEVSITMRNCFDEIKLNIMFWADLCHAVDCHKLSRFYLNLRNTIYPVLNVYVKCRTGYPTITFLSYFHGLEKRLLTVL